MAKLLYIESSPRKARSSSIAIAKIFLSAYQKSHADDEIITLDLWKKELPPFDGPVIEAKYAILNQKPYTPESKKAWEAVEAIIADFKQADKYVISAPMWNFGIPYKLKHYIDILIQPGYTFTASEKGYDGLVKGKKLLLICSRGGAYGAETGAQNLDMQISYLKLAFQFMGFTDIQAIVVEPTLKSEELKQVTLKAAQAQAEQLAPSF